LVFVIKAKRKPALVIYMVLAFLIGRFYQHPAEFLSLLIKKRMFHGLELRLLLITN